jgi:protein-L-isoaspartate(D-aspartate) O-methyltransferase
MGRRAADDDLARVRARYAAAILRSARVRNPRVEEAFAAVPREHFLTPSPWRVFSPGGVIEKNSSDPADLYDDVLVVLDRAQGINNGQPSLHAAWIAMVDPQPGETVLHIGAGTGYYTAILARLVGAGGRVEAYEIDKPLAALAERHLAAFPHVKVHAVSGVGLELPEADVIYVSAAATAPDPQWLAALKPLGRLIFPWQAARFGAVTLLVRRVARGFAAEPTMAVGFIPCVGAQAPPAEGAGDPLETRSVWLSADRPPDGTATAVHEAVWFSTDPV